MKAAGRPSAGPAIGGTIHGSAATMTAPRFIKEAVAVAVVFAACLAIFLTAPVKQAGADSRYSMLLSENLLRHRQFALERYGLPISDYRLINVDGHRYYAFPPGTSVLSLPYVGLMHLRGRSVVHADGTYDLDLEAAREMHLSALLMAAFAVVVFATSRLLLPTGWSLAVAFTTAFGTQVLSTMSRAMWSDTWGVLLVGLAAFLLLRSAVRGRDVNVLLLATIESWAYVVRPTNFLLMLGSAAYLLLTRPRALWRFALVIAAWLAPFLALSWHQYGQLLPPYFRGGRLLFDNVPAALLGNLVSPSRGLLTCVPLTLAVALMLLRYRRTIRFRLVAGLGAFIIAGHMVVVAGFPHWWGGHCFGARLTASLVPWIAVLAILAIDAFRGERAQGRPEAGRALVMTTAGVLTALSVAINVAGAYSHAPAAWNVTPVNIDQAPQRLWSVRDAQALAPFTRRVAHAPNP